jgi:primosomal protein N'
MKVVVRLQNGKQFTYEADDGIKVGTRVMLPKPYFYMQSDANPIGTVSSLETDYDGPCKRILAVLDDEVEDSFPSADEILETLREKVRGYPK